MSDIASRPVSRGESVSASKPPGTESTAVEIGRDSDAREDRFRSAAAASPVPLLIFEFGASHGCFVKGVEWQKRERARLFRSLHTADSAAGRLARSRGGL